MGNPMKRKKLAKLAHERAAAEAERVVENTVREVVSEPVVKAPAQVEDVEATRPNLSRLKKKK